MKRCTALTEHTKKFQNNNKIILNIKVKPGSVKTEARTAMTDGTIKINLKAIPEKGKANQELVKYLAKIFEVEKENVKIISGKNSTKKTVKIYNDV